MAKTDLQLPFLLSGEKQLMQNLFSLNHNLMVTLRLQELAVPIKEATVLQRSEKHSKISFGRNLWKSPSPAFHSKQGLLQN